MVTFLDDELYNGLVDDADDEYDYATTTTTTTTMMLTTMMEKLRVWGVAASRATRIDISLWDFVAREVHDDDAAMDSRCEREEEEEESAGFECAMGGGAVCGIGAASEPFLNGERSTRILPLLVPIGDYGSGGTTIASHPRNAIASVAASTEGDDGDGGSTRGRILSSSSVEEAVETFARRRRRRRRRSGRRRTGEKRDATNDDDDGDASSNDGGSSSSAIMMTSILLVGDEGCGKTHAMDAIQRRYSSSSHHDGPTTAAIEILRPDRTVDMVGNTIGSTEDRLIALFAYALERAAAGGNCLVVLDDVDRMFSLSDDDDDDDDNVGSSYHVGGRCRALFVTILDALRKRRSCHRADEDGGHLLLLCTARSRCGEMADRFDRVFGMGRPDDEQRRRMILSCLSSARADDDGDVVVVGDASEDEDDVVGTMASLVARHSVGKSACELAQCCREVMLRCAEPTSSGRESNSDALERRLRCLDGVLQTKIPQSLRGGSLEGVVDVRVFTPEELRSRLTTDENGDVIMPLLGAEATRAYDALMNVVVTPLCRSDEIRALLYGGGRDDRGAVDAARPTRVGALLAGAPGVGKTSLAYHCAAVAAKMARVSLLDVSATSLIHKEIGGSERAVRSLFAAVRAAAPCVLLIDGIESVAPVRGNDTTTEGTMDRVLSTFLTEMDGIEDGGEGGSGCGGNVAVIGITHLPDAIDPALLRPGRLEKTITLGAPEYGARREIVARQIEDIDFDFASAGYFEAKNKEEVSSFVANETAGMSAMEVIAICREASMVCLRELNFETTTKPSLTYNHFQRAMKIMKGKAGA
jgi:transitional endoplasmic reticulum ATPase